MRLLEDTLAELQELDQVMMMAAEKKLNSLSKPQGSLGKLEKIAIKLAGITGDLTAQVDNKAHVLMAADHGVVTEDVSAFPQDITTGIVYNFLML